MAKHRRERIRQHMQIGGSQIVVVMLPAMVVIRRFPVAAVVMLVRVAAIEHEDRQPVHDQPENGHADRLIEGNLHGAEQTHNALPRHQQRKQRQQHGPREPGQRVHLAGAEAESLVAGMAASVDVGQQRDGQGRGVGGHVQPVGQQRHRPERDARHDLHHHRRRRDDDHDQRADFARHLPILAENMIVLPGWNLRAFVPHAIQFVLSHNLLLLW